jgi:hypothetical protein
LPPSLVRFTDSLAFVGVHAGLSYGTASIRGAALWAAIGETRFIRLQLELLGADNADFDGESHSDFMIRRSYGSGDRIMYALTLTGHTARLVDSYRIAVR